jgi:hypothetical protein
MRPRDRERRRDRDRERDRRPILHASTPTTRVPADSTGGLTIGEARDLQPTRPERENTGGS